MERTPPLRLGRTVKSSRSARQGRPQRVDAVLLAVIQPGGQRRLVGLDGLGRALSVPQQPVEPGDGLGVGLGGSRVLMRGGAPTSARST